jgi:hypothetical protein
MRRFHQKKIPRISWTQSEAHARLGTPTILYTTKGNAFVVKYWLKIFYRHAIGFDYS